MASNQKTKETVLQSGGPGGDVVGLSASKQRGNTETIQFWLALMILIGAVLWTLGPVCRNDFTSWDDGYTIVNNPTLNPATWNSVHTWWTASFMDLYVPMTYTAWGVISRFAYVPQSGAAPARIDPMPFHVANLVVHVLAVLVVFQLLRLLFGKIWPAAAGAMLFGLHPVQVEAVAWVSGLKDVLGGLLALAAIWQYLLAVRQGRVDPPGPGVRLRYVAAMILYALAMLAKPGVVIAPMIAWILDCMMLGRSWRESVRWLWPWFVLAAAGAAETFFFQGLHVDNNNVALFLRPLVALDSLAFYLGKVVWPTHLGIDYGLRPAVMLHDPWLVLKSVLLAIGCVAVWRLGRARAPRDRKRPAIAAALLFIVPLLPVLGLITFDFQSYSNVADHYLYLPMLGVALAMAWICSGYHRRAVHAGAVLVLGLLGWASNVQAHYWKDSPTLLDHEMTIDSESPTIYSVMARYYLEHKDISKAIRYAQHALRLDPSDAKAHFTLGRGLWREGQKSPAMEQFKAGLRVIPDDIDGLEGLAQAMMELGRLKDAESLIRREIESNPQLVEAHFDLGSILYHEHRLPEAIHELQKSVTLDPGQAQFRLLLGKALEDSGQNRSALDQFQAIEKLDANSRYARDARQEIRRLGATR